jgi:hypothetical protein
MQKREIYESIKSRRSLAVLDFECFDGFEVFYLHFLKGEELHDVLFLTGVQDAGDLAAFGDKRITHRG